LADPWEAYGEQRGLRAHGHELLVHELAAERGHAQHVLAGGNVAQVEGAVQLDVRAMRVVGTVEVGQFHPVVEERHRCFAVQFSLDGCQKIGGLRPAGNAQKHDRHECG
jgi:hypothetical protein